MVLLVYFATDVIATWGLNIQFGVTGVLNFAYIVDLAVGAYVYAILTLGPASASGGFQSYILGYHLPVVAALALATLAGVVVGGLISLVGLRRLRPDYQAVALLVVAIVASTIVTADQGLLNGNAGLTLIPNPLGGFGPTADAWGYVVLVLALAALAYLLAARVTDGPLGRTLRAVRDDDTAAAAIGKNVVWLRIVVQCIGGGFAALSGALLAGFIGAWSPYAWEYVETISLLSAVIVGGMGNNWGVLLGTALVPVLIQQGSQYVPAVAGHPGLAEDFGWMVMGILIIVFIWFRPKGILPERRPRYGSPAGPPALAAAGGAQEPLAFRMSSGSGRPLQAVRPTEARREDTPLLAVQDLVVRFGGVRAVDGASFEAEAGVVTGLIGPNGAGKSTLINAVSGFVTPSAGRILFAGRDVTHAPPERRVALGLVRTFQIPRVFPGLTTIENLLVAAQHQRGERFLGVVGGRLYWGREEEENRKRAWELLRLFEMAEKADDLAGTLSGGQKRMLELMRALMVDPRLLLLDEPLAGLSPRWADLLEDALLELGRRGLSFVLVEHELGIVERLCDTVVVMAQGRVLATGSMADLRSREEVQAAYVIG